MDWVSLKKQTNGKRGGECCRWEESIYIIGAYVHGRVDGDPEVVRDNPLCALLISG